MEPLQHDTVSVEIEERQETKFKTPWNRNKLHLRLCFSLPDHTVLPWGEVSI